MKYLKTIIFACIVLQTTFTFSQQILGCEEESLPNEIDLSNYSFSSVRSSQDTDKYVFNMFFHIIRNNNGDNVVTNEETTLEAIAMLNITYNPFDIYFKYAGFDYIDDSTLLEIDNNEYQNVVNNLPQIRNDAFNVFIAETVVSGTSSYAGRGKFYNTYSVFNDNYFISSTLPHEIAHNFALDHTHKGFSGSNCEHVNGDNCLTKGDRICDTNASYGLSLDNVNQIGTDEYEYVNPNNDADCINDIYFDVPIRNFMSTNLLIVDNFYNNLRNHFTTGQSVWIRESIIADPLGNFVNAETTIASLYEPYAGEYYAVGPNTSNHLTKFQPGFDYTFVQCGGNSHNYGIEIYNQPTDYDNTSFLFSPHSTIFNSVDKFSLDFDSMFHPNHSAIFIAQLNEQSLKTGGQPRKCYNNFNRGSIGGTLIKFEDDILNTNVTIQYKNAQDINDNNLINNLQQGLYKIEKNYEDGSKKETLIYKSYN